MPTKQQINDFWGSLWSIPVQPNNEAPWLEKLRQEYCVTTEQKDYEITDEILDKALTKVPNDKPGRDLITGIWIKNMQSVRKMLKRNLRSVLNNHHDLPDQLVTAKTVLVSKNEEIHKPENYKPIAIQNAIYKTYTALIAEFIMDHCESNDIVTEEQAAGKRNSWGFTYQLLTICLPLVYFVSAAGCHCFDLLINKMIYEEVMQNRRNLTTVWLDYKKAVDSVPHSWIVESLKFVGLPGKIINVITVLMTTWKTKMHINGENNNLETDEIEYNRRIIQGDTLSLIFYRPGFQKLVRPWDYAPPPLPPV